MSMNTDTQPQQYAVSWTEGVMNLNESESLEGASVWVLKIGERTILHAVQQSPIHEAVSAEDRKLIGQSVANFLGHDPASVVVLDRETAEEVKQRLNNFRKFIAFNTGAPYSGAEAGEAFCGCNHCLEHEELPALTGTLAKLTASMGGEKV